MQIINIQDKKVIVSTISPLHADNRGWIISADGSDANVDQVSGMLQPRIVSMVPNIPRGNHYHKHETEAMIFINSTWRAVFADYKGNNQQEISFDSAITPVKLVVPSMIAHVLINTGTHTGYIFHYSDKPYTITRSIKMKLI